MKRGLSVGQAAHLPFITKGVSFGHSVPLPEKYESMSFCVWLAPRSTFEEPLAKLGLTVTVLTIIPVEIQFLVNWSYFVFDGQTVHLLDERLKIGVGSLHLIH